MATRSVRTPLSIKIAMGFLLVAFLLRIAGIVTYWQKGGEFTISWIAFSGLDLFVAAYGMFALPRLSRIGCWLRSA